jgi:hypothetical protein
LRVWTYELRTVYVGFMGFTCSVGVRRAAYEAVS